MSGWRWALCLTLILAAGLFLVVEAGLSSSATYDEVAYLEIACDWWRTGRTERIARMGSPLTFWKVQQAPILWAIDQAGFGQVIDHPIEHQAVLLPLVRVGSAWIFGLGLLLTAGWAASELGATAGLVTAAFYALSPNLIGHGSLVTMEAPLVAASAGVFWAFTVYLRTVRWQWLVLSAMLAGLAFSCKFTAVLLPVLCVGAWGWTRLVAGNGLSRVVVGSAGRMAVFLTAMALGNVAVTLGTVLPLSKQTGAHPAIERALGVHLGQFVSHLSEIPVPQDAAAFVRQLQHQGSGGPSYLLGQTRQRGWWYYYLASLLVKVPLGILTLAVASGIARWRRATSGERLAQFAIVATLVITAIGSSRNYGFRYILFLAPPALVMIAALAQEGRAWRVALLAGLVIQAVAVSASRPSELSYFNVIAGGSEGGKHWLADSNLDWGQGLKALVRLQKQRPELRDLTLLYFGDTDPRHYGVSGTCRVVDAHGPRGFAWSEALACNTPYIAVSRSLQYGPWAPAGVLDSLRGLEPVAVTDDHTIAVYRRAEGRLSPRRETTSDRSR
jgi:hypothetical protein